MTVGWFSQCADDWFDRRTEDACRPRHEMRERALYNAVNLHCETGDSMAIFDRSSVSRDVLATAEEFYAWITAEGES